MTVAVDTLDRAAWLDWRRGGIGASDVAGILGISPWESPYSVWAKKVGLIPDDDATEAMMMGLALEPTLATLFHQRTGLYVAGHQTLCTHIAEPWARASLDGGVTAGPNSTIDDALAGYEAKTTSDSPSKWVEQIPAMYAAQVQWQMWVTGHEMTWLGVLHASFGLRFRTYEVERDEEDISLIVDRCRTFWAEHVEARVAPRTDAHVATTETLKSVLAEPGVEIVLADDAVSAVLERDVLKRQVKELDEDLAAVENRIRVAMGEATEGRAPSGELIVSWREQTKTLADADALRDAGLFERFSKTSTSRTLRRHKSKEN